MIPLANAIVLADQMPDISPTYDDRVFPFMSWLLGAASAIQGVGLIVVGILFIVGVISWFAGKAMQSATVSKVGGISLICGVIGAALVGGAFAIVRWGGNVDLINTGTSVTSMATFSEPIL